MVVRFVSDSEKKDIVRNQQQNDGNIVTGKRDKISKAAALVDQSQRGNLPRVVASGQGTVAEQILQIAWSNNIKVREDADLAEVLSAIDVESEIPIEAFAAVAEILSYVYRANAGHIDIAND